MQRLVLLAAAAAALAASYGTAVAQSVGVELYSGPRYDTYYDDRNERRAPHVYGYYRDAVVVVAPRVIVRPSNCGQFRYWNGTACVDARINPPNLN
jgi:hypothetical protein